MRNKDGKIYKSQYDAVEKYKKEHYERLLLYFRQKGMKDRLKAEAEKRGIAVNQLICDAIEAYLSDNSKKGK